MVFFCSEKIINLDVSNSIVSIIIFIFEEDIFFLRIIQWNLEKKDGKYEVSNLHFQRHNHCSKSRIHISQKYTPINSIIYVNLKDQYSFKFTNFQILSIREK